MYPKESSTHVGTPVTLITSKHQEVFTFVRPNYEGSGCNGKAVDRKMHPDLDPQLNALQPFYRPEPVSALVRLPQLRPSVLYVFGARSEMSQPAARSTKMETTGTGVGGSGGFQEGRVKEVVLEGIGHLVAMEAVAQCADAASAWTGAEMQRWREEEEEFREWSRKSQVEKTTIDERFKEMLGGPLTKAMANAHPKL